MRSLITGVGGFVGQHLAALLLQRPDAQVFGIARRAIDWHARDLCAAPSFRLTTADLGDAEAVGQAVRQAAPERLYLLAAMSSPAESFRDPVGTISNNVACVVNVLEAVRELAAGARVLLVSSAEVYGSSPSAGDPVSEGASFAPENPYALSKVTQDLLGYQYGQSYALDIVRLRPFNHIGPGQSDRFVATSFAKQVAEVEAGIREPVIEVGNLNAVRDFTDVRDVALAYELALDRGQGGEAYNLATGKGTLIQDLLDGLIGRSRVPVRVEHDPSRLRPADASVLVGDATRFTRQTGWRPTIPLDQTLSDILDDWRGRVRIGLG